MPSFGSSTTRPSKTQTRTSTSKSSRTTSAKPPQASASVRTLDGPSSSSPRPTAPLPRRRLSSKRPTPEPDSDSPSDESDFAADLQETANRDLAAIRLKDAQAERRRKLKAYRDRGETPPKELLKPAVKVMEEEEVKGKGGKGKGRAKEEKPEKKKPKIKADEMAVMKNAMGGRVSGEGLTERGRKMKKKARNYATSSDEASEAEEGEDEEVATRPSLNLGAKKKEVEKRTGIRMAVKSVPKRVGKGKKRSRDSEDGGQSDVMENVTGDKRKFSHEAIRKHLQRRWIKKGRDPTRMSAERKEMELVFNPLISLLNIRITVVEGTDDMTASSGSERGGVDRSRPVVHTDDEDEDEVEEKDHEPTDDTDWGTDGMGEFNGEIKTPPRRAAAVLPVTNSPKPAKRAKVEDSEEEEEGDVKPTTTPQGSPSKTSAVVAGLQLEVLPDIVIDDDDEEEPSTEEDEPNDMNEDVKPSFAALNRPTTQPVASSSIYGVKQEKSLPDIAMAVEDVDDDSGAEPDTEGSDIEISEVPAVRNPHFPSHHHNAPSSSQQPASSPFFPDVKAESQSQLSQHYSQSQSQRGKGGGVKLEPTTEKPSYAAKEEEDADEEEDGDVLFYDMGKIEKNLEMEKRLKKRREMDAAVAERRREREKQELARRSADTGEGGANGEEADEEEEEEEEERLAWQVATKDKSGKVYPLRVKKGRPKFLLQDAKQAAIGHHSLSRDPTDTAQIPAPLNKFLRPYQREGAEFLYGLYRNGTGGILGDDMGLGKTIQVIAFLSAVMGKTGLAKFDVDKRRDAINARRKGDDVPPPSSLGKTCLIACPASVVHNWEREFQTWGYFDVMIYPSGKKQKLECLDRFDKGYADVVIGSIEAVRNSIDDLARHDFSIVIVDEAHRVKNPYSNTTKALHQFSTNLRYGLTGTAVQNRLSEFWCILNWCAPGKVGTLKQWESLVSKPIKYAQKVDATEEELVIGRTRAQALVTNLLPHFWLRRTKDDPKVKLQLPKKTDHVVLCPLTPLQKGVYRRILALEDVKIMLTADDPCPCGARDEKGLPYRRGGCCEQNWSKLIFKYIILFQKISNHLGLIYPNREEKEKQPEKFEQDLEWVRAAFPDDWQKRKPGATAFLDPDLCGKWKILCDLLNLWAGQGDKVLIFSMSLKVLSLLQDLMETTHYKYLTLDGSTPQDDRMPLVDEFNDPDSDVFAFLISTRAGGVGLNLTAANKVVIFDPNWNPSHDLQAMDRAYRFGQRREVNVYRLVGAGTLEELIYNRQQYKRSIAATAYDATAERRLYSGVEGEGKEEQGELWGVKNIFKFSENVSLTEMAIKRADLAELEYALKNTSFETTKDGKFVDLPDEEDLDPDEAIAEVMGFSKKGAVTQNMTLEELAAHKQQLAEQAQIARILGGVSNVVSDATLGGSHIETTRAKNAVQAATSSKNGRSGTVDTKSIVKKKGKAAPEDDEDDEVYDPLARGRGKKRGTSTAPSASALPISSSKTGNIFSTHGISSSVPTTDILAASGYHGSSGVSAFWAELEGAKTGRDKAAKIERVAVKFKETMRR